MIKRISTPNLLEVCFLVDRHHEIVSVDTHISWPYGIEELSVTLEGDNIDLDHANFIRTGYDLSRLPQMFTQLNRALWRQQALKRFADEVVR